jgi:hypothetical protein
MNRPVPSPPSKDGACASKDASYNIAYLPAFEF